MSDLSETFQLIFQIIQWVGSLFGLVGGLILLFRFLKERPILKIEFLSNHYMDDETDNSIFHIDLEIDNIGDKPTTIKEIYFMVPDKIDKDTWYLGEIEDFKMFHLNPRSSYKISKDVAIGALFEENVVIVANIDHTHGHEEIKIESYYLPEFFPDEDEEYFFK